MEEATAHREAQGVLTDIPRYATDAPSIAPAARTGVPLVNLALFLLTLLTTTMAGAYSAGAEFWLLNPESWHTLSAGLSFSIPLMSILLAHEMGHYLASRRYGVSASLPYFIPAPFPSIFFIGTFGAFIRQREPARTRRAMFDIGAAGPWAGVLVAIPCVIYGLRLSQISPLSSGNGFSVELGNSLLFLGLARWILGIDPNLVNVNLHATALAGWIGLFVTALNLLPMGQLDGGHVVYTLFPRAHRKISVMFVIACVLLFAVPYMLGRAAWFGWAFWGAMGVMLGLGHPSTIDRNTPLNFGRQLAAWLTVVLFVVTFMPVPLWINTAPEAPPRPDSQSYSVHYHAPSPRLPNVPGASIKL